jgi:hypothetical protein
LPMSEMVVRSVPTAMTEIMAGGVPPMSVMV